MNLTQLYYIREVADAMSINKAAQKLFMSQSSLSKSIAALENELGTPLLSRSHSGITLTPYGEYFVAETRDILDRLDQLTLAANDFGANSKSTLTVASGSMSAAGHFFAQLAAKYETIHEKDFRYYRFSKSQVVDAVCNGTCDIGILILLDTSMDYVEKLFQQSKLEYHVLGICELGVNIATNNPLMQSHPDGATLEQLQGFPMMTLHEEKKIFQLEDETLLQLFPNSRILESYDTQSAITIASQTLGFLLCAANNALYERAGFPLIPAPIRILDAPYRYEIGWIKRSHSPLTAIEAEYIKLLTDFF